MSEKIHPPTPRRRQQAKEQGRVPRSGEMVAAGSLLATTGLLAWCGPALASEMMELIGQSMQQPRITLDTGDSPIDGAFRLIVRSVFALGLLVAPMCLAMMMCAVAFNLLQTGWAVTPRRLQPSLERLSPGRKAGELLSARTLAGFGILLLRLAALIATSVYLIRDCLPEIATLAQRPLPESAASVFHMMVRCCGWVGTTLLIFAVLDYALAWWHHERDLMMSEQELREELRNSEATRHPSPQARTRPVQPVS
ncbi:EscU/YscU/HrcU family type III secretion system export apparatus switch protein [Roseiconus nitratireducens]|uniref:EscU/YscU/HrcU family type III secretion system export apparatus switch protein n=1 Tax=Roseiconus nitratireducens TaxID=2605748 RepID=A0A5M6DGQ6_9BACT|nr:EscU/YscU/HrcU family type III secretion system export apparatus switch protein [Roseiconus nitratireducens]KAA5544415.1 EscU/YscU/HrcU family type III secretion system export apparatus switch protein [Roseiconus nitratireducens]